MKTSNLLNIIFKHSIRLAAMISSVGHAAEICFKPDTSLRLPFEVARIGAPSLAKDGNFKDANYFPATSFRSDGHLIPNIRPESNAKTQFRYSYNLWANRCVNIGGVKDWECPNFAKTKGNYYRGIYSVIRNGASREVRPIFTTYARANACTRIQASHALGLPMSTLQTTATTHQLRILPFNERATEFPKLVRDIRLSNGSEDSYFIDVCLLDRAPAGAALDEIALDYEVQDSRPESSTQNIISQLASLAHNKGVKLHVFTNEIDGAMAYRNGISQNNLDSILESVDSFGFTVGSGATLGCYQVPGSPRRYNPVDNMNNQIRVLTNYGRRNVDFSKILPWVNMYDMAPSEARGLHSMIRQYKMKGIYLPNSFMEVGGSCSEPVNVVISNLLGLTTEQERGTSFCKISQKVCPNHPESVGTFTDTLAAANNNQARCMQRAKEYHQWCGLTNGQSSSANYVSEGQVRQTATYSGL